MKLSLLLLVILLFTAISISNHKESEIEYDESQYILHAESSERLLNIMQQISPAASGGSIEETVILTEEDMVDLIEAVEELHVRQGQDARSLSDTAL